MQGKVVLITGGAKRVGAATCRRLHAAGANLMLHYRESAGEARLLQAELNNQRKDSVALIQADLLDLGKLSRSSTRRCRLFGSLDALVNNASSFFQTPVGEITAAQWEDLIGTNLRAPMFLAQAAAPALEKSAGRDRQHHRHPCRAPAQELRRLQRRQGGAGRARRVRSRVNSRPRCASMPSRRDRSCGRTTPHSTSCRASASFRTRR